MRQLIKTTAVTIGLVCVYFAAPAYAAKTETYNQLNLFADVFERIRSQYVKEIDDEELIEAAINGMLTSLDPHSTYLNSKRYENMRVQTSGEFGGLGIEVTMDRVIRILGRLTVEERWDEEFFVGLYHLQCEKLIGSDP